MDKNTIKVNDVLD